MAGHLHALAIDDDGYLKLGIIRPDMHGKKEWLTNWWAKPAEKSKPAISMVETNKNPEK